MKRKLIKKSLGTAAVLVAALVVVALQAAPERTPLALGAASQTAEDSERASLPEFGDVIGVDFEVEDSERASLPEFGDVIGIDFEVEDSERASLPEFGDVIGIDFEPQAGTVDIAETHVEWFDPNEEATSSETSPATSSRK